MNEIRIKVEGRRDGRVNSIFMNRRQSIMERDGDGSVERRGVTRKQSINNEMKRRI